ELRRARRRHPNELIWEGAEGSEYPAQSKGRRDGRERPHLWRAEGRNDSRRMRDHRGTECGGPDDGRNSGQRSRRSSHRRGVERTQARHPEGDSEEDHQLGPQQTRRPLLSLPLNSANNAAILARAVALARNSATLMSFTFWKSPD